MAEKCQHRDFHASVKVNAFDDLPEVFTAAVQVECRQCGRAMQFFGVPTGFLWNEPSIDALGTTINIPMRPYVKPEWMSDEAHKLQTN